MSCNHLFLWTTCSQLIPINICMSCFALKTKAFQNDQRYGHSMPIQQTAELAHSTLRLPLERTEAMKSFFLPKWPLKRHLCLTGHQMFPFLFRPGMVADASWLYSLTLGRPSPGLDGMNSCTFESIQKPTAKVILVINAHRISPSPWCPSNVPQLSNLLQ